MSAQHQLRMVDLGLGDQPVWASIWLVDVGSPVTVGDRLLEVATSHATVDLPAPASGRLVEQLVSEGDRLSVGQLLALIEGQADDLSE